MKNSIKFTVWFILCLSLSYGQKVNLPCTAQKDTVLCLQKNAKSISIRIDSMDAKQDSLIKMLEKMKYERCMKPDN